MVEVMDTRSAIATFNILSQEGRNVMGALLPQESAADGGAGAGKKRSASLYQGTPL